MVAKMNRLNVVRGPWAALLNAGITLNGKSKLRAQPSFCSMKQLGVLLLPLDGMLVHHRVIPRIMSPVSV